MKFADMQKHLRSGRFETRPRAPDRARNVRAPAEKARDSELPLCPDLFAAQDAEHWLLERLKQHGHDPYTGGLYATMADRLAACIVRNGVECVIVGRGPDRKPETYRDCWQRLFGRKLPKAADIKPETVEPPTEPQERRSASTRYPILSEDENRQEGPSARATGGEGAAM